MKRSEVYVTVGLQKEAKEQEIMEIRDVNFLIFLLTTNFRKIPFGTEHRIQNKRVWWRTKVTIKECYFVFFFGSVLFNVMYTMCAIIPENYCYLYQF